MTPTEAQSPPRRHRHPAGLMPLFFTEMWERFSYYGMRGLLILYMTAPLANGGLGFDIARAGAVYGLYSGLVYLACLPGGWIADRLIGTRRATLLGGVIILGGHLSLALPVAGTFTLGLALLVIGTGLLKPNVSTMVGQLYAADDPRRDSGFSIYYMGINLGALLAPLVCGWLAMAPPFRDQLVSWGLDPALAWHWGFGAAAVGMAAGLVTFLRGTRHYGSLCLQPARTPGAREYRQCLIASLVLAGSVFGLALAMRAGWLSVAMLSDLFGVFLLCATLAFFAWIFLSPGWSREELRDLRSIALLFVGAVVFWSLFEQGGSTLTLFAEKNTDRHLAWLGYAFPSNWLHTLNPLLIIALAPGFAWLWMRLGARNPTPATKFVWALVLASAGFGILIAAAGFAESGIRVSPWWLIATYVLHTFGELCLSPVGLSAMTRLAPARIAGLTMGVWFLATSVGSYLGARVAGVYDAFSLTGIFTVVTLSGLLAATGLALFLRGSRLAAPAH